MASGARIRWDRRALGRMVATGSRGLIETATAKGARNANSLGAGYRTPKWHDPVTGETRGDTAPVYGSDVETHGIVPVGLVYTANYAAMKDTYEHNTLLKAVPHV